MIRSTVALVVLGAGLASAGCSLFPSGASVVDPRVVYVWPADRCPSDERTTTQGNKAALLAGIGAILVGDAVSALIQVPAQALANAAEADKNGFTATGQNARFYYGISKPDQATIPTPPGCYIVAYSSIQADAKPWCDDRDFAAAVPRACAATAIPALKDLRPFEPLPSEARVRPEFMARPDIYMEISLDESSYPLIVRPGVAALYYPKSLLAPDSSKPRTLSLTLTPTSLVAADALKGAAVAITISGVEPGQTIRTDTLNVQSGWTSVPRIAIKVEDEKLTVGERYSPFNVAANLHEVGQPSLFLAAFAKSFNASVGDLGKVITPALLPSGQAAAKQQAESNLADYDSKRASAQKAYADYLSACDKKPASESEKANAENLYWAVVAARRKANVAAAVASEKEPFGAPENINRCF